MTISQVYRALLSAYEDAVGEPLPGDVSDGGIRGFRAWLYRKKYTTGKWPRIDLDPDKMAKLEDVILNFEHVMGQMPHQYVTNYTWLGMFGSKTRAAPFDTLVERGRLKRIKPKKRAVDWGE
jgi:hypothetical protein